MAKDKRRKYTPGMEDIERTFDHLDQEEKKARRKAWLKEHYGKQEGGEKNDILGSSNVQAKEEKQGRRRKGGGVDTPPRDSSGNKRADSSDEGDGEQS